VNVRAVRTYNEIPDAPCTSALTKRACGHARLLRVPTRVPPCSLATFVRAGEVSLDAVRVPTSTALVPVHTCNAQSRTCVASVSLFITRTTYARTSTYQYVCTCAYSTYSCNTYSSTQLARYSSEYTHVHRTSRKTKRHGHMCGYLLSNTRVPAHTTVATNNVKTMLIFWVGGWVGVLESSRPRLHGVVAAQGNLLQSHRTSGRSAGECHRCVVSACRNIRGDREASFSAASCCAAAPASGATWSAARSFGRKRWTNPWEYGRDRREGTL
jgi:hypothetical protein